MQFEEELSISRETSKLARCRTVGGNDDEEMRRNKSLVYTWHIQKQQEQLN